jgi:hypothetical protein
VTGRYRGRHRQEWPVALSEWCWRMMPVAILVAILMLAYEPTGSFR